MKIQHHPKILSRIARSLAIPELSSNDQLWFALSTLYGNTLSDMEIREPENRGLQEALAVALAALAIRSRIKSLQKIIANNPNGDGVDWLREKAKEFLLE